MATFTSQTYLFTIKPMFRARHTIPRLSSQSLSTIKPWIQSRSAVSRSPGRPMGITDHWTAEKLAVSTRYPLSAELSQIMHPTMVQKKSAERVPKQRVVNKAAKKTMSNVHLRNQIVSPGLCDDVLKYIGHTLEQHKGCDILDINPGACLWSQKLHDVLKPRSHILLEPNPETFQTFLEPLINGPDSTYELVTKDPLRLSTYRELVDEGAFPHQLRVDPKDPKAQDYNKTLLVTGSLVWDPRLPGIAFDSMAKQLFHHFASAAWSNDLFHAFGPVRTLLWVQSDDFNSLITKTSSHMLKANRLLEMTNDINVIVGSERQERTAGRGAVTREPQYEIESTIHALRRGREKGLVIPEHRRDMTYDYATKVEEATGGSGISSTEYIYDLMRKEQMAGNVPTHYAGKNFMSCVDMEQKILREHPDVPLDPLLPVSDKRKRAGQVHDHPARELLLEHRKARSNLWGLIKAKIKIEAAADIQEDMFNLERKALKMKAGPKRDALVDKIKNLDEAWEHSLAKVEANMQGAPNNVFDDRINLRYPPHPRIQWDGRPFDPLLSYEDEAWPRNRLSLISATPLPKPVGETDDYHELVTDFVHGLYAEPGKSLPDALNSMQHSMSDIIKDCPSLTDPDKGGRMLMKHLRVRMLTMEMVNELVRAYRDWPFKAQGSFDATYFRHKGVPFSKSKA